MSTESLSNAKIALEPPRTMQSAAKLARWTAGGLIGLLLLVAMVLCWRRLATGLSQPLGLLPSALVGVSVGVLAAAARTAWGYSCRFYPQSDPVAKRLDGTSTVASSAAMILTVVISTAVVAVGAALSLPRTTPGALAALWGVLAIEEAWAWFRAPFDGSRLPWRRATGSQDSQAFDEVFPKEPSERPIAISAEPPEADVLQQITRSGSADGNERLTGWLRVPVARGQRTTSVHVAFCPPFARIPTATVEQLDGPDARIKTVQLLPYGVRFDLKLSGASPTEETVLLRFEALSKPEQVEA